MICIILLVCLLALLYWKIKSYYTFFEELGIVCPKPFPLFGNVGEFKNKSVIDVFIKWRKTYGTIYGFYEGLRPSIVVSDPYMTQQILSQHFDCFQDRPPCTPFMNTFDEHNLLMVNGDLWKQKRHIVACGLNSTSINQMIPKLVYKSNDLLSRIEIELKKNHGCVDAYNMLERHMMDSFLYAAFDHDCNSLVDNDAFIKFIREYRKTHDAENVVTGFARLFPSLKPICQLFTGDLKQAHKNQLIQFGNILSKEKLELTSDKSIDRRNMVKTLLTTKTTCRDENNNISKRNLTDGDILAQMNGLISGGMDASVAVVTFLVYCLAIHQDVQTKVQEEIDSIFSINDEINMEKLHRLTYLDMVLNESMRMFPVAPGVERTCTKDTVINGVQFKQGLSVRIMSCAMYTDPDIYPEPEKFIPERFSEAECKTRNPYSFLPFGGGPKRCIGLRLGVIECKLTIVQILKHYRILQTPQTEVPLITRMRPILCPTNGVHIKLEAR